MLLSASCFECNCARMWCLELLQPFCDCEAEDQESQRCQPQVLPLLSPLSICGTVYSHISCYARKIGPYLCKFPLAMFSITCNQKMILKVFIPYWALMRIRETIFLTCLEQSRYIVVVTVIITPTITITLRVSPGAGQITGVAEEKNCWRILSLPFLSIYPASYKRLYKAWWSAWYWGRSVRSGKEKRSRKKSGIRGKSGDQTRLMVWIYCSHILFTWNGIQSSWAPDQNRIFKSKCKGIYFL